MSTWLNRGDPKNITPLLSNVRLLYKRDPNYVNEGSVKEFTNEQIGNMDMDALDYVFADDWFKDKMDTFDEYPEEEQPVEQSATEL
ncbi:MAG: hypothetical protein ACKPKO_60050, partial [Candidatus Fonsibacter sp.]